MQTYKIFYLIIGPFLLFQACDPKTKTTSEKTPSGIQISVDANQVQDTVEVTTIVKKIEIIPLKPNEGDYIAEAWKIIFHKNLFIVFDRNGSQRIHVYTANGELEKSIVPTGRGPNEVSHITDCWINENGHLEIFDSSLNRILVFDENFDPIRSFKGEDNLFLTAVQKIGNKYIGFGGYNTTHNNASFKVAILDDAFKVEKTAFDFNEILTGASISTPITPFSKIGNEYIFSQNYDKTIYNISNSGEFTARYQLNYSPNPLPDNFHEKIVRENIDLFKSQNVNFKKQNEVYTGYSGYRGQWIESDNYSFFDSFDEKHQAFVSIYNKKSKEIIAQGRNLHLPDKKLILPYIPHFSTVNSIEDCFYTLIEGYMLMHFIEEDSPHHALISNEGKEGYFIVKVCL